jgi:flagellar basal body-associated protein FliL
MNIISIIFPIVAVIGGLAALAYLNGSKTTSAAPAGEKKAFKGSKTRQERSLQLRNLLMLRTLRINTCIPEMGMCLCT